MDAFFRRTPIRVWEEFKVANAIMESYDAWIESLRRGNKRPWKPPDFKPAATTGRRRINGDAY